MPYPRAMNRRPTPETDLLWQPAPELVDWIRATFLDSKSRLWNPEHDHLNSALIGALWTYTPNVRKGRRVLATAELWQPPLGSPWTRSRATWQIHNWFRMEPHFILTFDAEACVRLDDISWCALVEHELYHCGQALNEYGCPRFKKDGTPVFWLRGHDVEEFTGVIRRYGLTAHQEDVQALVEAAAHRPEIDAAETIAACGLCVR